MEFFFTDENKWNFNCLNFKKKKGKKRNLSEARKRKRKKPSIIVLQFNLPNEFLLARTTNTNAKFGRRDAKSANFRLDLASFIYI